MSVLVVTGESRGIGADICRRAADKGWACAVNHSSDKSGADTVVSEITAKGAPPSGFRPTSPVPLR